MTELPGTHVVSATVPPTHPFLAAWGVLDPNREWSTSFARGSFLQPVCGILPPKPSSWTPAPLGSA